MKNELFNELLVSIQEMDNIVRGKICCQNHRVPGTGCQIDPSKYWPEPESVCLINWCEQVDIGKL